MCIDERVDYHTVELANDISVEIRADHGLRTPEARIIARVLANYCSDLKPGGQVDLTLLKCGEGERNESD